MAVRRYAEGTQVSVESSRGEITGILAKHGVQTMGWMARPDGDELMFELHGATYRFAINKPTTDEMRDRAKREGAYLPQVDLASRVDKEWRRRWRAHVLLLKAKMEFAAGGDTTIDREFMPFRVLKDGRTIEQALIDGGLPLLTAGSR